ncbi:hypothetical protein V6N13_139684 [Hibiscus sabdariffa]
MTRKKIKLAYITNDAARNAAYKKRKKGVVKKLSELTILCGVEACAVIYPPGSDSQPETWPSTVAARSLFSEYKILPVNRMVNQESFLEQLIKKTTERLEKLQEENRRKELTQVMFQNLGRKELQNVKKEDLDELGWLIDQNLKNIDERIHALVKAIAANENFENVVEENNSIQKSSSGSQSKEKSSIANFKSPGRCEPSWAEIAGKGLNEATGLEEPTNYNPASNKAREDLEHILAFCVLGDHRLLREEFAHLRIAWFQPWFMSGDFSTVRSKKERSGQGILKLPILHNFIASDKLDNIPFLLSYEKFNWGPRPFKLINAWLSKVECIKVVKETLADGKTKEKGGDVGKLDQTLQEELKSLKFGQWDCLKFKLICRDK